MTTHRTVERCSNTLRDRLEALRASNERLEDEVARLTEAAALDAANHTLKSDEVARVRMSLEKRDAERDADRRELARLERLTRALLSALAAATEEDARRDPFR